MEPVVLACDGCGAAIRDRPSESSDVALCRTCGATLAQTAMTSRPRPSNADDTAVTGYSPKRPRWLFGLIAVILCVAAGTWWGAYTADVQPLSVAGAVPSAATDAKPNQSVAKPLSNGPLAAAVKQDPPFAVPAATKRELSRPSISSVARCALAEPASSAVQQPALHLTCAQARDPEPSSAGEPLAATPAVPAPVLAAHAAASATASGECFKIRDENGEIMVGRLHGQFGDKAVLLLPDGRLGIPNMLVHATEPFRPFTADELLLRLQQGPLADFHVLQTPHYLIFYLSSHSFAEQSSRWLEDLYRRLLEVFRQHEIQVHEAEFPLVAVIYRNEAQFRASRTVEPEVQALYEIFTNRNYFYESSDHDQNAPEVSALRKPQTVVHEGTHQVLQNIGVHPRLSAWPIWLVEGLAEYCATPASSRKGGKPTWDGLGMISGLHLATIRELEDPLSVAIRGRDARSRAPVREPGKPLVESLIRKTQLNPTEYALAWAMTHYLAFKRQDDFVDYLKAMSQIPPLEPRSPEDHVAEFQKAFGSDLAKIDRAIEVYLKKLAARKGYDPMPFYAVMFEQSLPAGLLRKAAMVSQSPEMIQQWVQGITHPQGAQPIFQAFPHPTQARALLAVEAWIRGN